MTLDTLRQLRGAAPFRPFDLHLSDGRVLRVATEDHLLLLPNNPEFIVVLPDGGFRIIDPSQVASACRAR